MIRYFCDMCGHELSETKTGPGINKLGRLTATLRGGPNGAKLTVEVLESLNDVSNAGLFCKYCILDALYTLDDRPKAV